MKYIDFNINNYVRVKLTEEGKTHYIKWHKDLKVDAVCPAIDSAGYCKFQMHELMNVFGSEVVMGLPQMFNSNIKIQIDEESSNLKPPPNTQPLPEG